MNRSLLQPQRQVYGVLPQTRTPLYVQTKKHMSRTKADIVTYAASSSISGDFLSYEYTEEQVAIYDKLIQETTQQQKLRKNLICYAVAAGILIVKAISQMALQIDLFPNFGVFWEFIVEQLQVGFGQLVTPSFGPPCIAAFAFLRWKFRHEMESVYLGSFGRILEATQKVGLPHDAKMAWEKLLVSQWLLKYGLGWVSVAFLACMFLVTNIANFLCTDVTTSLVSWINTPLFSQAVTHGWMSGMVGMWVASSIVGYVIMGDLINMGSYTILKTCLKFDPIGSNTEEEEDEDEEEEEEVVGKIVDGGSQNGKNTQNGVGGLGKIVDLDKNQYQNIPKQKNLNQN